MDNTKEISNNCLLHVDISDWMKDPALTWKMGTSAQEIDADGRLAAGQQLSIMLLKNAYLLRCAASFVTAAYVTVRLIPQDLRALHLSIF